MGEQQTHTCEDYLRNCSDAAGWNFKQKLASQCCGFCTGEYVVHTTLIFSITTLACQLQPDCPEHSSCIEQGNNYTCECKDGFFQDDNTCLGMYSY